MNKSDNEIIALFMGANFKTDMPELYPDGYYSYPLPQGGMGGHMKSTSMAYHISWDWLMPVVQKIAETHDFTIQFHDGDCNCYCYKQDLNQTEVSGVGHGGFSPHIKSVYLSVLAFIKKNGTIHKQQ